MSRYSGSVRMQFRRDTGTVLEIIIAGDFNRHDQLWGGDDVSLGRQGEADPIIDLMNEFALSSLLKRGIKTWHGAGQSGDCESTIDLVLTRSHPVLTHSHPILTSITPVSRLLTHITHSHPKIKSDAILKLRAH